jgi:hypothetical protein
MSKQTAVEWLIDEIRNHIKEHGRLDAITISQLKIKAKEMEREQIMIAASHAHFEGGNYKMSGLELFEYGFKYYTSTYE